MLGERRQTAAVGGVKSSASHWLTHSLTSRPEVPDKKHSFHFDIKISHDNCQQNVYYNKEFWRLQEEASVVGLPINLIPGLPLLWQPSFGKWRTNRRRSKKRRVHAALPRMEEPEYILVHRTEAV